MSVWLIISLYLCLLMSGDYCSHKIEIWLASWRKSTGVSEANLTCHCCILLGSATLQSSCCLFFGLLLLYLFLFAGAGLAPLLHWWACLIKMNERDVFFHRGLNLCLAVLHEQTNWAVSFHLLHFLPDVGWDALFYNLPNKKTIKSWKE